MLRRRHAARAPRIAVAGVLLILPALHASVHEPLLNGSQGAGSALHSASDRTAAHAHSSHCPFCTLRLGERLYLQSALVFGSPRQPVARVGHPQPVSRRAPSILCSAPRAPPLSSALAA
jgi:hypothetical protein